jgi:RNA polymerase sigma-70 factor (ECF subfamily)
MDDEALAEVIRGAQRGESASFDRLVESYSGRIYGFLYRVTGSKHDAEDLMQEVFLRLVRTIAAYEHFGRFEAWVFRIAANLARDRVRRVRRSPLEVAPAAGGSGDWVDTHRGPRVEGVAASGGVAEAGLVLDEEIDALNAALAVLPDAEREVIMLRHFSQMSFKEIAETMGTPLGTALARSHRGLGRLREIMSGAPARPGSVLGRSGPRVGGASR